MKNNIIEKIYLKIKDVLSSNKFLYAIIALVIFQGLWYALMYQPIIYDEGFHIKAIYFYAEHINPFNITPQSIEWDFLGDMSRNVSYVFYYLMSIPLRFVQLFTSNYMVQVIVLRLIMTGFFVASLTVFRKAFTLAGFSRLATNIALLFTVLLPYIAPFSGVVNYDNVILFLFSLGIYQSLKIINLNKIRFIDFAWLIFIIFSALLIKFNTALALFTPILLYVVYFSFKKYKKNTIKLFYKSFKNLNKLTKYLLIIVILTQAVLIIERPVANYVIYHSQTPKCEMVLTKDRCMANYTYKRNFEFKELKPDNFKPIDIWSYFSTWWLTDMIKTSISMPGKPSMPIVKIIYYTLGISGIILILINMKDLLKSKSIRMLIIGCITFSTILFLENYRAYVSLGQPVAMSGRYLLPYIPIFGVMAIKSYADIASYKVKRISSVLLVFILCLLVTQGGGVSTAILTQDTFWADSGRDTVRISNNAKQFLRPIIVENLP